MPVVTKAPSLGFVSTGVTSFSTSADVDSFLAKGGTALRGIVACVSHAWYPDKRFLPSVDGTLLCLPYWKVLGQGMQGKFSSTLTDPMIATSAAEMLGSAWLWGRPMESTAIGKVGPGYFSCANNSRKPV